MHRTHTLSIIVDSRWGTHHLPRLFQSLAWQTSGLDRVEVVVLQDDAVPQGPAALWPSLLPCTFSAVVRRPGETDHQRLTRARQEATGDLLLHPDPTTRFTPYFLQDVLHEFDSRRGLDVVCTDFVDLGRAAMGLVRLPRFTRWRLRTRNILGPQAVIRAGSLAQLPGPRADSPFVAWDLGVQGALAGFSFSRLDRALYSCALEPEEPSEAVQAAAMVVVHNQAFFREDVVRWALAAVRRTPWALAQVAHRIPGAREVRQLYRDHVQRMEEDSPRWLWALGGPPAVLPATVPARSGKIA